MRVAILSIICAIVFLQTSFAADNEANIKQAVENWQQLKTACHNAEVSLTVLGSETSFSVKHSGDSFSVLLQRKNEDKPESILYCLNPKYGFTLSGGFLADEEAHPIKWKLSEVSSDLSDKLKTIRRSSCGEIVDGSFKLPFCPALQEMLTDDSCSELEFKEQSDGTVEINFDFEGSEDLTKRIFPLDGMKDFRVKGVVSVEPASRWAIQNYDFELTSSSLNPSVAPLAPTQFVGRLAYESVEVDGAEYPYPVEHVVHQKRDGVTNTTTYKTKSWHPANLTESDFTLSAYGLPEMDDKTLDDKTLEEDGKIRPFHVFLVVGVALVLLAGISLMKKS